MGCDVRSQQVHLRDRGWKTSTTLYSYAARNTEALKSWDGKDVGVGAWKSAEAEVGNLAAKLSQEALAASAARKVIQTTSGK